MPYPASYILDTNAIIQSPNILSTVGKHRFLIPNAVFDEVKHLRDADQRASYVELIEKALESGAELINWPSDSIEFLPGVNSTERWLSVADLNIINAALHYVERRSSQSVAVITNDRVISEALSSRGINVLGSKEFLAGTRGETQNQAISASAKGIVRAKRKYIAAGLAIAAGAPISFYLVYLFLQEKAPVGMTVIFLVALGYTLFQFRQRRRLWYGMSEVFAGIILTGIPYWPYLWSPNFDFPEMIVNTWVSALGGLYAIVRGLDNIGTGIKGTSFEPSWKRYFP